MCLVCSHDADNITARLNAIFDNSQESICPLLLDRVTFCIANAMHEDA